MTEKNNLQPETVRLMDQNTICIDGLKFQSEEVYRYLSNFTNLEEALIGCIETGSTALNRINSTMETDFISKRIQESFVNLESSITKQFDPLNSESVAKKFTEIFDSQNKSLLECIYNSDKNTQELQRIISEFSNSLKGQVTEVVNKQVADGGGLQNLVSQVKQEIINLRDTFITSKTTVKTSAPLIGADFEHQCQVVLEEICNTHSLELEDLRNRAEAGGSKVGDYRIIGPTIKPIVLEMKNRDSKLSLSSILKELDNASNNRACDIAILVASSSCIPPESYPINFYSSKDKYIVCDESSLRTAIRIALSKARLEFESSRSSSKIDITMASEAVYNIRAELMHFGKLKNLCSAIKKNAIKIEDTAMEAKESIEKNVTDLIIQLNGNGKEEKKEG